MSFPFSVESESHSSYHGLVANVSVHTSIQSATQALRFEDTYTENSPTSHTTSILRDNNGNVINAIVDAGTSEQKLKSISEADKANVNILFEDVGYACTNELELTLGFETFVMNDSEKILKLPEGRYYYRIKGDLSCASTDGCEIDNTGIIDISGDTNLVLTWQVTDYQNCWMSIKKESYFTSVID